MIKKNLLYDILLPRLEPLGWVLACVGFSLMWALQPVGSKLFLAGMMALAYVYMLGAFEPLTTPNYANSEFSGPNSPLPQELEASQNQSGLLRAIASQLVAFGTAAIFSGILFKLLSWQDAPLLLPAGVILLGVGSLLRAFIGLLTRKYVLIFAFGAAMLVVPAEAPVRQFHRDDPVLTQLLLYQLHHPRDQAAGAAVRQYLQARRK